MNFYFIFFYVTDVLCNCCSGDTTFVINYDGRFENLEEGLTYVDGKIHYLETSAQFLFGGIISANIVDMYGQRVWYKLPNESLSDLKVLCDGGIKLPKHVYCYTMGKESGSVS